MKKLTPMTDFVLEQLSIKQSTSEFKEVVKNYANFLKQPLTLGMFVPVDEEGNALSEPTMEKYGWYSACSPEEESGWMFEGGEAKYYEALKQWEEAKEKVLFTGFYKEFNAVMSPQGGYLDIEGLKGKTIETIIGANLELTPSALKTIGL